MENFIFSFLNEEDSEIINNSLASKNENKISKKLKEERSQREKQGREISERETRKRSQREENCRTTFRARLFPFFRFFAFFFLSFFFFFPPSPFAPFLLSLFFLEVWKRRMVDLVRLQDNVKKGSHTFISFLSFGRIFFLSSLTAKSFVDAESYRDEFLAQQQRFDSKIKVFPSFFFPLLSFSLFFCWSSDEFSFFPILVVGTST